MTSREAVLEALFEQLQSIIGPNVLRNESLPEKVPVEGLLILRDGDLGEPEVLMSPLSYYWEHIASLEVFVQAVDADERNALMDSLFQDIADVLAENPMLDGLCDRVEAQAPDTNSIAIEGAAHIRAAIVPIELIYTTASQLG